MKKFIGVLFIGLILIELCGFSFFNNEEIDNEFSIESLYNYEKEFEVEEIETCASNSSKTYMDYRATTLVSSRQYQFMHNHCTVDKTGFLLDEDNFIAVALGSFYGEIGDRFYFTLDSGVVLPLVKAEEKADVDTDYRGCYHTIDGSVIEFVIDANEAARYFGVYGNGYVLSGNYNNYPTFNGEIVKVERVMDKKNTNKVTYSHVEINALSDDMFNYGSGY